MRIAILQFPGATSARETAMAVARAGMEPVDFFWNEPSDNLKNFAAFILVGGFSYEDRGRAGFIAAKHPIVEFLKLENEKGKPILGICNGAQILVEAGFVPGLSNYQLGMALTANQDRGFINSWVKIRLANSLVKNVFTQNIKADSSLLLPIAHAEGRFVLSKELSVLLNEAGLGVLEYAESNPNGSAHNWAAISNPAGNVLAMMPHPERSPEGDSIFTSLQDYLKNPWPIVQKPINYCPIQPRIQNYEPKTGSREIIVQSVLKDNAAYSLQQAAQQAGYPVVLRSLRHWEVKAEPDEYEAILKTGLLFNSNKERLVSYDMSPKRTESKSASAFLSPGSAYVSTPIATNSVIPGKEGIHSSTSKYPPHFFSLLIRDNNAFFDEKIKQRLIKQYGIQGLQSIRQAKLWHIYPDNSQYGSLDEQLEAFIYAYYLFNPYSQTALEKAL